MTLKFSENAMSEKEDLKRVIISYEKKMFYLNGPGDWNFYWHNF